METITTILVNILSNVLTQILLDPTYKGKEPLRPYLDTTLTPILQKAVAGVGRSLKLQHSQNSRELERFLVLPEIDAIVRQIYSIKLSPNTSSLDEVRAEFELLFNLYLASAQPNSPKLISRENLFTLICDGCDNALNIAINRGVLSAHEAKSSIRYHLVMDEIAAIQRNLEFLKVQQQPNIKEILQFEQTYRQQISIRHGKIIPPNFYKAQKFDLDQLYVCPNFSTLAQQQNNQDKSIELENFLASIYRVVLLGNPGGGKSTFTDKLCNDLVTRYEDKLLGGRQVTPIHVVLRDYGAEKKKLQCSILQFIESTASSKYQVRPPEGAFEYLLLNGRAVVIFDGLDELLDTSYRQAISGDVEAFCNLYPAVPVLVTSREVGYEQAPLDNQRFETFTLSPFQEHQVEEYANKWFSLGDYSKAGREQKEKAFLDESTAVPDLRSNPLMLGLLCNIYRGEGYIPRNRPDVYEKCAMMLFEKWDKSRGIEVSLPFQQHIRPTMMHLAYWIYADEALQGGVTEKDLIERTTDYLHEKRFEDYDEARQSAWKFVEFCRGRAWVFTDVGTTKDGERLYQFTHRTFLEYFTAKQLVRSCRTPRDLEEILLPKIANREWDVVAQIAFQDQESSTEGAGDELLQALIKSPHSFEVEQQFNMLSFAIRCLEFIVPSPKVRKEIAQKCFQFCFDSGLEYLSSEPDRRSKAKTSKAAELIRNLFRSSTENITTVLNEINDLLIQKLESTNDDEVVISLEILFITAESRRFSDLGREIPIAKLLRVKEVCTHSKSIFYKILSLYSIPRGFYHISHEQMATYIDSIGQHEIYGLFRMHSYIFNRGTLVSPAFWITRSIISAGSMGFYDLTEAQRRNFIFFVGKLGKLLLSDYLPPYLDKLSLDERNIGKRHFEYYFGEGQVEGVLKISDFNNEQIFGLFLLLAIMLEINEYQEFFTSTLEKVLPEVVTYLLLARDEAPEKSKIELTFEQLKFKPEQRKLISRWIKREVDFVKSTS